MLDQERAYVVMAVSLLAVACGDGPRFEINQDGTVDDTEAGLTWQHHAEPLVFDLADAIEYCDDLELAGGGWSLPTLDQLLTTRAGFPEIVLDKFWARDAPREGWHVSSKGTEDVLLGWAFQPSNDGSGSAFPEIVTELHHARCAR